MPTYEYECKKCEHTFEVFHGISEKPIAKCPECGGKVRRLIGRGAGIIFKGSGFYQTDYRSDSYRSSAKADSASTYSPASGGAATPKAPAAKPSSNAGAKAKSEAKKSALKT